MSTDSSKRMRLTTLGIGTLSFELANRSHPFPPGVLLNCKQNKFCNELSLKKMYSGSVHDNFIWENLLMAVSSDANCIIVSLYHCKVDLRGTIGHSNDQIIVSLDSCGLPVKTTRSRRHIFHNSRHSPQQSGAYVLTCLSH